MTDSERLTRRNVLKATGAAAAIGLGSAGTAAAQFDEGECVYLYSTVEEAREHACPPLGEVELPPPGEDGIVLDDCWEDSINWVKVEWSYDNEKWHPTSALKPCQTLSA